MHDHPEINIGGCNGAGPARLDDVKHATFTSRPELVGERVVRCPDCLCWRTRVDVIARDFGYEVKGDGLGGA